MDSFLGIVVGLTASMFAVVGGAALLLFSVGGTWAIHWSFWLGIFLVPIWLAACIKTMIWASDL